MEELKFSVTIKVKDMYWFLMRHAYSGISGIINLVISGGALVLLISGYGDSAATKAMLGIVAALFTVINPLYLYYKAARQVKLSPMFAKPLDYCLDEAGIAVSQEEDSLAVSWVDLRKVVETKNYYYVYLSLTRAYIFPKAELRGRQKEFRKMVSERVDSRICKCKWRKES